MSFRDRNDRPQRGVRIDNAAGDSRLMDARPPTETPGSSPIKRVKNETTPEHAVLRIKKRTRGWEPVPRALQISKVLLTSHDKEMFKIFVGQDEHEINTPKISYQRVVELYLGQGGKPSKRHAPANRASRIARFEAAVLDRASVGGFCSSRGRVKELLRL
jgi:hypothetical protein